MPGVERKAIFAQRFGVLRECLLGVGRGLVERVALHVADPEGHVVLALLLWGEDELNLPRLQSRAAQGRDMPGQEANATSRSLA